MFKIENNKVKIDIKNLPPDFKIISNKGLHLILPKSNFIDWNEDTKWLRSIVVDDQGFVKSCSWKKFGNYNEFKDGTNILNDALANNKPVIFSHKEDGSLMIRSVINGQVIMRTRGTLFGGESDDFSYVSYGEKFKIIAKEKYPILLDANFMTDRSLLFEYVAPSNQVVIAYKEEDLIFLGFIVHNDLKIGKWDEIEKLAKENSLNLVRTYDLNRDVTKLIEEIKTWKDEGIVIRCNDDQVFIKIKSASYLASHAMRFRMNYLTMLEFIELGQIKSELELIESLRKCDYDWEIIEKAKEFYKQYENACKLKDNIINTLNDFISEFNKNNDYDDKILKKKNFALLINKTEFNLPMNFIRSMAFALYDGKNIDKICKKIIFGFGK